MRPGPRDQQGSALLLVFFVCMAAAVVLQAAWGTLLCAQRAVADESVGRQRLDQKDDVLAALRRRALELWEPLEWTRLGSGEGTLAQVTAGDEWLLEARARQASSLSLGETSAWMERGRDGIDLPMAALVAGSVTAGAGRESIWVGRDERSGGGGSIGADPAQCFLQQRPAGLVLAARCECLDLRTAWHLDAGWTSLVSAWSAAEAGATAAPSAEGAAALESGSAAEGVAPARGICLLTADVGLTEPIPADCDGTSPEEPVLVVLAGGATLDARGRGDIYGVLVVDGGSVLLEGTIVHGAVIASGSVSLGMTGEVLLARDVLRWATDRSLARARLLPGTRREGME
jgi:hypothetical protein